MRSPSSVASSVRYLLVLFVLFAWSRLFSQSIQSTSANDAIQRALQGLRSPIAVANRSPVRWTLADRMTAMNVPGFSLAIIEDNRIVWAGAFGVKESGSHDSVTVHTLFEAQSISKPVAATAMLLLVQRELLSLDEDVNRYLKTWRLPQNRFTTTGKVTLREIVSHSAGITVSGFPGYRQGDSIPTLTQILDGQAPANNPPIRLDTVPGLISRYSGGGFTIMQQLLIDLTGDSFPSLMRQLVLGPADMTLSTYEQPLPMARWQEAASGHDAQGVVIAGRWPIHPEMAAAGLWTTPTDLAHWILEIAGSWRGDPNSLLSQNTARQMLTVQKAPFGFGVVVQGNENEFSFGHSGANTGFRAEFLFYPALGEGAVIMTNADLGGYLNNEVFHSLAAELHWPAPMQSVRSAQAFTDIQIALIVGAYAIPSPYGGSITYEISQDDRRLFAELKGFSPRSELCAASNDTLFTLAGHNITVSRDSTGRVVKLLLNRQLEAIRQ